MSDESKVIIAYTGNAVDDGSMDAKEFATALLGINDLCEEANRILYGSKASVQVNVDSNFQQGSFEFVIHLNPQVLSQAQDLWGNVINASAVSLGIKALIGFGAWGGVVFVTEFNKEIARTLGKEAANKIIYSFIPFITHKKDKIIDTVETISDKVIKVKFKNDSEEIIVPKQTFDLAESIKARRAMSTALKPVKKKGVSSFQIRNTDKSVLQEVNKVEVDYFEPPEEIKIKETSSKINVIIISLSFKEGLLWKVTDGNRTYSVAIEDEEFIHDKVKNGKIRFGDGDVLTVDFVTREQEGQLPKYAIKKVLDYTLVERYEQLPILTQENDLASGGAAI